MLVQYVEKIGPKLMPLFPNGYKKYMLLPRSLVDCVLLHSVKVSPDVYFGTKRNNTKVQGVIANGGM